MNIRVFVSYILFMLAVVACNVSEQESVDLRTENSKSDETFSYSNKTNVLVNNTTNLNIFPIITTSGATYTIEPELPTGLTIAASNGVISGTPSVVSTQTLYIITANTPNGKEYAQVTIEVTDEPVKNFSYDFSNLVFTQGTVGTQNVDPTSIVGGTPTSFTVDPALPVGLTLNPLTGQITGTPTTVAASFHDITASNDAGEVTIRVLIDVQDTAPTSITYNAINFTSVVGTGAPIDYQVTAIGGSPAEYSFSISPNLPAGVVLNTSTGQISGVPTTDNGVSSYTVTVQNSQGSATQAVTINITNPPTALTYNTSHQLIENGYLIFQEDVPIVPISVDTYNGGDGPSYACSGCPTGVSVNSTTGTISGTPTTISTGSFTIDVTRDATTLSTAAINYQVVEDYPEDSTNMGYVATYNVYVDQAANISRGVISGGNPTSFRLVDESYGNVSATEYNLPINGLTIDYTDGSIQGTPTAAGDVTIVIEGLNQGYAGSPLSLQPIVRAQQSVRIISTVLAPTGLGYSGTGGAIAESSATEYNSATDVLELTDGFPLIGNTGTSIDPSTATAYPTTGGRPDLYTIIPALPNGLTLNSSTGVISGTPTENTPITYYQITGTNDAGSFTETIAISTDNLVAPSAVDYNTGGDNADSVPAVDNQIRFELFDYREATPTVVGSSGTFTISPTLPLGLAISPMTGVIYGTPLESSTTTTYSVTFTNSMGSFTNAGVSLVVENTQAPANLVYQTSDGNTATGTNPIILYAGDTVTSTDVLTSSDYDPANPGSSAGFIHTYTPTAGTTAALTAMGLALDTSTGAITSTGVAGAIATDPREQSWNHISSGPPATDNMFITGSNDQGSATQTEFPLYVLEKPPVISYPSDYGTNVLLVKGDARGATATQYFNVSNTGGLVARDFGGGAITPGATRGCSASYSGTNTKPINQAYLDFYATDNDDINNTNPVGAAAGSFQFEPTNCSFRFNADACFTGAGEGTYNYTITAHNSGTDYTSTPVTTNITVLKYDVPNYVFEPAGGTTLASRLADDHIFYEGTYLNLDGVDEAGGSALGSYTPNTDQRCHNGSYNLVDASTFPSDNFSFAAGGTGEFSVDGQMLMLKTPLVLSATESVTGYNLSKTTNIELQVSHIEATSSVNDKLEVKKVDVNADGLMDVIIRNTECDNTGCANNNTSIYKQISSHVGYFDGVDGATTAIAGPSGMIYVTGITYGTNKGGILAITDDRDDFWSYSATHTTESLVSDDSGLSNNDLQYPGYGIVPMESGTATRFGVITLNGTANVIQIEEYIINNENLGELSGGDGISANGQQIMNDSTGGGIDVDTIQKVEYADIDGNGFNEAIIAYTEEGTGDRKICLVTNDGTTFAQDCMGEITLPAGETFVNFRFADVSGTSDTDILVQTWNAGATENTIYVYEYGTGYSGNFNTADILNLNSNSQDVSFDVAQVDSSGKADLVVSNVDGDIDSDGTIEYGTVAPQSTNVPRNTGITIYNNSNTSDVFQDSLKSTQDTVLYYHNASGTTNWIELIPHGSNTVLMHCSYQYNTTYANTTGSKELPDVNIMSCGIPLSF